MTEYKPLNEYFSSKMFEFASLNIDEYKKKSELLIQDILEINKSDIYTKNYHVPYEKIQLLENAFLKLKKKYPCTTYFRQKFFL